MHIISILREHLNNQVSEQLVDATVYGWAEQFNNIAGRITTPVTFLVTPTTYRLECDTITAREDGKFTIYFLTPQEQLDFDAVKNEELIDTMIPVAVDLIGRLKLDKRVHIEDIDVDTRSMYNTNNKNLTGVMLKLHLKESQGWCLPAVEKCR